MIEIDITMLIQIINILVLIAVMNAVLYRPVRTILSKRQEKLDTLKKDIETFAENTKLRQEEIDGKLRDARDKAKEQLDSSKNEGQAAGNEKLTAVRQEVTASKTAQLEEIQKQFNEAREQLKGQVDGFASEMAGKILGRSV